MRSGMDPICRVDPPSSRGKLLRLDRRSQIREQLRRRSSKGYGEAQERLDLHARDLAPIQATDGLQGRPSPRRDGFPRQVRLQPDGPRVRAKRVRGFIGHGGQGTGRSSSKRACPRSVGKGRTIRELRRSPVGGGTWWRGKWVIDERSGANQSAATHSIGARRGSDPSTGSGRPGGPAVDDVQVDLWRCGATMAQGARGTRSRHLEIRSLTR